MNHALPNDMVTSESRLANIIVESYNKNCSDSFAYVSGSKDHALIVFDYAKKLSWKAENSLAYPSTDGTPKLNMAFGLALGEIRCDF